MVVKYSNHIIYKTWSSHGTLSGGCDSTLQLHDLLIGTDIIRALTIVHPQVVNSGVANQARQLIKARLKRMGKDFYHTTVTLTQEGPFSAEPTGNGLAQPLLWLPFAVSYLRPSEDLYMAYVSGDDIWHYRQYLYDAFTNLQTIGGRTGKLILSMEWMTKMAVIERLKEIGLYRYCHYCEETKTTKPCGKCNVCIRHRAACWTIAEQEKIKRHKPKPSVTADIRDEKEPLSLGPHNLGLSEQPGRKRRRTQQSARRLHRPKP
jgi:7-cyano-7-deazaguanine synthase in queuosine biosynthesis